MLKRLNSSPAEWIFVLCGARKLTELFRILECIAHKLGDRDVAAQHTWSYLLRLCKIQSNISGHTQALPAFRFATCRLLSLGLLIGLGIAITAKTLSDIQPVEKIWQSTAQQMNQARILDRNGVPLAISYESHWNEGFQQPLHEIPSLLKNAFITSEDKRFYEHNGVDWLARMNALWQNVTAGQTIRGASTITEQVVRMLNPRPRTLWSKWIEGFEASRIEQHYTKSQILEFYLNQIPYASHRRGVDQAAQFYFNRSLSTLTPKEMLSLVILVRAPGRYDLYQNQESVEPAISNLADRLLEHGTIDLETHHQIAAEELHLEKPSLAVNASHFVSYLRNQPQFEKDTTLHTTLDSSLQKKAQQILDDRIKDLTAKNVHNGAALIADHQTGEILAWVVAGENISDTPGHQIDAVTTARQPGSTLKPFLYATALDRGWTASTIIDDSPLTESIGTGLHQFSNYSHHFYGNVTVREALGNSLNIPALKTIQFIGAEKFLDKLHQLGFDSLTQSSDIYDSGLALGNGEVTLYELVQAYATLANGGQSRSLAVISDNPFQESVRSIFSDPAATLIGNILSDPHARQLEFGTHSVLNLPVQTAVKTGTSSDYRDAWVFGYNDRFVVGIWMGNLDYQPMNGITGGTGPALAMRSIFNELNKNRSTQPLRISPELVQRDICLPDTLSTDKCYFVTEWFMPHAIQDSYAADPLLADHPQQFEIIQPTDNLKIAIDPRVPLEHQQFAFKISGLTDTQAVQWVVNDTPADQTRADYLWPLKKGTHTLYANVVEHDTVIYQSSPISWLVK